jgi:alcohol dehydrogenase
VCTGGGGWILGRHTIDGLQAEFARVPFADTATIGLSLLNALETFFFSG